MRHTLALLALIVSLPLTARDLGSRPIVLVHGYGPDLYTALYKMNKRLTADGVKSGDILSIAYDTDAAPDAIVAKIGEQLERFLGKRPPGTHFDVIGHSLGGFVGLYAPLRSRFAADLEKFISLTGWAHGQNQLPSLCAFSAGCGATLPLLIPYQSPFITAFFGAHATDLSRIKKFALYSLEDKLTGAPADSGAFPDGVKIEIKQTKHFDFINDEDVYRIMTHTCYDEPAPEAGFEHEWLTH